MSLMPGSTWLSTSHFWNVALSLRLIPRLVEENEVIRGTILPSCPSVLSKKVLKTPLKKDLAYPLLRRALKRIPVASKKSERCVQIL